MPNPAASIMSTARELDPPSPESSLPCHLTRAVVDAGAISTSYIRAGVGAPLLLLDPQVSPDGSCTPLVASLAVHFRVLAPEAPAPDAMRAPSHGSRATAFSTWLRGFLDGLGLPPVSILARDEYALPSLSFCFTDAPRVERLVLTHRDVGDPALGAETLPERLDRSGVLLLVLREDTGADRESARRAMTEAALRFLRGTDPAAP
jgi:hypothetical protein